jgi:hypothetical protein
MLIMDEVDQRVGQILDGFCENRAGADLFPAVGLLRACHEQLSAGHQTEFFKFLAGRLQSERIHFPSHGNPSRSSHILIIRAWAAFGPADALPGLLFSLLKEDSREAMESWESMIGREFLISLSSYSSRFSGAALATIKAQCASITCDQSVGLTDSRFPPALVEVAQRLENLVKDIEFERNVVHELRPQLNITRPAAARRDATQEVAMGRANQEFDPARTPTTPRKSQAGSWKDFHERFMQLAREEQGLGRADAITNEKVLRRMKVLRAHCDYKDYRERVFVAQEVRSFYKSLGMELTSKDLSKIEAKMLEWTELEKKAGLKAPETGRWTYGTGAVSENFRERVRLCVVEAGRSLPDYPEGTDPEDFWLHQLYLDLLKNNGDLLFCGSKEGGMILSVCVASATFCARLERQALQQSEPGSRTLLDRLREIDPNQPVRMTERREHNARTNLVEHGIPPTQGAIASLVQNNKKPTQGAEGKPSNVAAVPFRHSESYNSVTIRGETFTVTPRQAQFIEILHQAHTNGNADVSIDLILEKLETPNSRWQDTWRSSSKAKKALIKSARKGTLRLNL